MSNRLRASMRAGNKGRSLRPRTSPSRNSAVPPESDLATSEHEEAAAAQPASADPEMVEAPPAAPEVIAPATITPAEVLAAGEAFSDQEDEDEDEPPPAKAEAPVSVQKIEAPVVAKKAEEPKKAEPIAAVKKVEEPKKAEPIAAVKKVEAPVVAKKAEPAPASNKKNEKKGGKSEGPKSEGKRPANDEVDDSSISAEFFRREGDSLPPMVDAHSEHEEHDEAGGVHVLSPATIARRARLRRVVAGVVAFAGVITLAVVGKTLAAGKQSAISLPAKPPVTQEAKAIEPKPAEKAAPVPVKVAEPVPVEAPKASAEVAKAEPDPKADAKPVEEPKKADEPKAAEPSGGDVKALTKEAESFLNRGNRKDAMVKAREAIAADPTQAMAYLLLGSALQDSGKWKDGIEAYSECVRNATKGPVSECRQMGGHK